MEPKYLSLTWGDIYDQCVNISEKIKAGNTFWPDVLISIGRGGMIPTRILSDLMRVNNVQLFDVKLYTGVNKTGSIIAKPFNGNIYNMNVLLVDDIVDTGKTLDYVMECISKSNVKSVRSASLLCKKHITRKPSYYSDDCDSDVWVIYPWEQTETPLPH